MHGIDATLLVWRIWVQDDVPGRAMYVELTHPGALRDPQGLAGPAQPAARVMRAEDLAALAGSLGVSGMMLRGDGSMLGRSGLRRGIRYLRACYAGWIGLATRGPDPLDLQSVLGDGRLDFADVQLAWEDVDGDASSPAIRTGHSLAGLQYVLARAKCPCVVHFTSIGQEDCLDEVAGVFDAFVRNSSQPVAVGVFEASGRSSGDSASAGSSAELLEYVACRPASMLDDASGDWFTLPAGRCVARQR